MKTFMFPGQGSQFKGMGEGLFDQFKELTEKADSILGYSIETLCLKNPKGKLNKTQFTQPALFTVNALSYFKKVEETGEKPDFLAGHSLGEFNALMAAGCFDFGTGLELVKKRGELMGKVSGGGMAAVLNISKEKIEETLKENGLNNVYLANYNSPSQIVISGPSEEITKAHPLFEKQDTRCFLLNTSGAFHSKLMEGVMEEFVEFLKSYSFSSFEIPVISNVTARPYKNSNVPDLLSRQIANTVQWSDSVRYLMAQARKQDKEMEFEELGPGDVLTKLASYIKEQTEDSLLDSYNEEIDDREEAGKNGKSKDASDGDDRGATAAKESPASKKTAADTSINPQGKNNNGDKLIPETSADPAEKVRDWNDRCPVGTKVKSKVMDYNDLETRTEAVVLFGHRAAVYMKGYNGYFDLDEVEVMQ